MVRSSNSFVLKLHGHYLPGLDPIIGSTTYPTVSLAYLD